jgi:4-hydroxybenzoate polyprenyltransferase
MNPKIKALLDLLRLHFFFVWPILFCAGLFTGLTFYSYFGGFSLTLVLQAVLIGFFGFEAGLVLNDIMDANIDKKDLPSDTKLTKYWRPFGERPIPNGLISRKTAIALFVVLVAITVIVIFTLPMPNSLYVFTLMVTCYCLEVFYQIVKRNERFPIAQIVGRVDFALFLCAGYLCIDFPDLNVLFLFLFFYPLALAHLGVNDLIDVRNDEAKGMKTIPTLYSIKGTVNWIVLFSAVHLVTAIVFLSRLGSYLAIAGFAVSFLLIIVANVKIFKTKSPEATVKVLPLFHVAMLIYAITIIANYAITLIF